MPYRTLHFICCAILYCCVSAGPSLCSAAHIPPPLSATVADRLSKGIPQDLLILFDDRDVEAEASALRQRFELTHDDANILAIRRERYRTLKQATTTGFSQQEVENLRDYDHLPMSLYRFKNRAVLDRILADPRVRAVYEDRPVYPHLASSLPFIGQPAVAGAGYTGSGQMVAVIDTGIDYTQSAFGSCSAPGVPAGCRVAAAVDVNGNTNLVTTPGNHGTNVAGIVAGVAPGTQIASFNALPGGSGTDSSVIAGINWTIWAKSNQNPNKLDITALNMSLGDGSKHSSPCSDLQTNPYITPINNARSAGIIPVASTGNNAYINNVFVDGIASPACTLGVVSVGSVYDSNIGGWNYGSPIICTDASSNADKIVCSSNSASFMTMLAPGAQITAAGITMFGTSQASPHVAGAVAVMRAAYPGDTLDQTVGRLTSSGVPVADSRNGVTTPRLNLSAAIGAPANNMFAQRTALAGDSGHLAAHNLNATKEAGEPAHAGNTGGASVWWSWTPSISGVATFDTHGSAFDTLLAVYDGTSLAALNPVAVNDNDGSPGNSSGLTFTALAGNEYLIAVDGTNGGAGGIALNWSLDQQADLGISLTQGPAAPVAGEDITYTLFVTNQGPSVASGVMVTDQLPTGATFVSASTWCSLAGGTVTCDLGNMASGSSVTVRIVVNTATAGKLINSAQVSSTVSDPQPAGNSASSSIIVRQVVAVPAVSPWGMLAAAVCLAGMAGAVNRKRHDPDHGGPDLPKMPVSAPLPDCNKT